MAESKLAFQIASSLATQHLTDSKYIQGTYHVVETIADRDALTIKTDTKDGIIVTGSLVYVSDEGMSYRYNGTVYKAEAGGGSGGSTVGWKYKGEIETAANLPTGPAEGDIYTVSYKEVGGEQVADGHNYFAHMQSFEIPLVDELSTAPIMCQCFGLFDRKEIEDAFQNYPYFGVYSHPGSMQVTLIFSNNPIILGITSTNGEAARVLAKADEEFKIFGARKVSDTEKILVNVTLTKQTNTVTIDGEEYTYYGISAPEVTWNTFYCYNNITWLWANYLPKTFDFRTSTKADMTNYNQKEVEIVPAGLVWKLVSGVDGVTAIEANPTEEATETLSKVKIDNTVYSIIEGGGSSSVKIYDNDDDTTTEGKLWNCTDGKLVIDNLTANYSELEIYYSQKDTSNIQYYKINTELITLPKTNKGMFYIFDPTVDIYRLEPVTVEYNLKEGAAEGDKKAITITSTAGENSEVRIERVYGKE